MQEIMHEVRIGDYRKARQLIKQTPKEHLCDLAPAVAGYSDDGTAMRIIIEEGFSDYLARTYNDETILHVSVKHGNVYGTRELLKAGIADSFTQDTVDECLVLAARFSQHVVMEDLIDHTMPTAQAIEDAALEATTARSVDTLRVMFNRYQELIVLIFPMIVDRILRVKKNRVELVDLARKMLAECPHAATIITLETRRTALHVACTYKHAEAYSLVRFLTEMHVRLDAPDSKKLTPMHIAYNAKNKTALAIMLAVPNSPIMWTATTRSPSIYNRVLSMRDTHLLDMMLTGNKQLRHDHALIVAVMNLKSLDLFEHLLKTYPMIAMARGHNKRTILMTAIFNKVEIEYIDLILKYNAYTVDQCDEYNNTALHYAAIASNDQAVERLLQHELKSSFALNVAKALPLDLGAGLRLDTQLRMLLVSRRILYLLNVVTRARILRACTPAQRRQLKQPPTMLEILVDAERQYLIRNPPIRHYCG